jgi:hypothetical protein
VNIGTARGVWRKTRVNDHREAAESYVERGAAGRREHGKEGGEEKRIK